MRPWNFYLCFFVREEESLCFLIYCIYREFYIHCLFLQTGQLDDRGSYPCRNKEAIFSLATASRRAPASPTLLSNRYRELSAGVKPPGLEAHHSLHCSAEVKNAWSYTSTFPYVVMIWYLVKHRDFVLHVHKHCPLYPHMVFKILNDMFKRCLLHPYCIHKVYNTFCTACAFFLARRHEGVLGSGGIAPLII
jgi:hypothetical protein